jgi:hypothetical protein
MPVKIKKVKGGYQVSTPNAIHAKHTTKKKALAQERLLNMKEHGITPKGGWRKSKGVALTSYAPKKKRGK